MKITGYLGYSRIYGCHTCVKIAIYVLKMKFSILICTQLYYWPLPLDFQTFLRSLTILTTGATEADKAELGLELRLESIIVVDPLSLPLYEIR